MNDPAAKTTAEWPGIEEAAGEIRLWSEFSRDRPEEGTGQVGKPDEGPYAFLCRQDVSGRYGVIAMNQGVFPTGMGVPAVLVAVWIGVTVLELSLAT
jgi:hypothetical protein